MDEKGGFHQINPPTYSLPFAMVSFFLLFLAATAAQEAHLSARPSVRNQVAGLQVCNITTLQHYNIATLQHSTLQFCNFATFQHC